ncbi:MAG: DUF2868 domain-containing protein [Rhodocyclaceae bacterium]|nr:DUF2868 domain-containing protein [Rhodocyclaceae bacterium]
MARARFDAFWLAEAIRLRELREGRVDDAAVLPALEKLDGFDARVLARAETLATRLGWHTALDRWHAHARLATWLFAALACSSGAALAWTAIGDGSQPVNLVWALLGLLGMHLLSLALWTFGMLRGGGESGAALGRLWLRLVRRVPESNQVPDLAPALGRLLARQGLGRWLFGMLSHGLWTLLLGCALMTLVALFSLRRYGFVWETTILSPDTLATWIATLDALPAAAGFGAPDLTGLTELAALPDRAAWARWLMACVALYGLLPRLLLWAWCRRRWAAGARALRIDLGEPDNLMLRRHLMPEHGATRIADPAPAAIAGQHLPAPRIDASAGAALVGVELGPDLPWPPSLGHPLRLLARVDSRGERQAVTEQLAGSPPRRLLVAFDARISPDRGTIALFARLAAHAGQAAAWLLDPGGGDPERPGLWREALIEFGLPASRIIASDEAALLWLEHDDA